MLAVIDYGAGNLRSVLHALRSLGVRDMHIVQQGDELCGANAHHFAWRGRFRRRNAAASGKGVCRADDGGGGAMTYLS